MQFDDPNLSVLMVRCISLPATWNLIVRAKNRSTMILDFNIEKELAGKKKKKNRMALQDGVESKFS